MSQKCRYCCKSLFGVWRTKILRAADAFSGRRREGPYRFIQIDHGPVIAMKSDAAAEKSKDQLWRDFQGCSIFDFCNSIDPKRTYRVSFIPNVVSDRFPILR